MKITLLPVLARDMRRYFSLVGVPSLAPAVAIAKADAAESALRLLSISRQDDIMPLLHENMEKSTKKLKQNNLLLQLNIITGDQTYL